MTIACKTAKLFVFFFHWWIQHGRTFACATSEATLKQVDIPYTLTQSMSKHSKTFTCSNTNKHAYTDTHIHTHTHTLTHTVINSVKRVWNTYTIHTYTRKDTCVKTHIYVHKTTHTHTFCVSCLNSINVIRNLPMNK